MTAPLVKDYSRAPLAEEFIKENIEEYFYNDADLTATTILVRSGQLWERIAEGKHNPSVITPSQGARIGGVRNELGTRSGRTNVRGRLVCNAILNYRERHICPEPWSHGIIKGTRQATTEATPYVLTEDAPEARATYGLTSIDDE